MAWSERRKVKSGKPDLCRLKSLWLVCFPLLVFDPETSKMKTASETEFIPPGCLLPEVLFENVGAGKDVLW